MNFYKYGLSDFRITVIFILIALSGYFLIPRLRVQLQPAERSTEIYITYTLPGASPEVIDKEAGSLIEEKISALEGIEKIESYAYRGYGYTVVKLDRYTSPDEKRLEIAMAVRQLSGRLPSGLSYPQISMHQPEDKNRSAFLVYQINADRPAYEIYQLLEKRLLSDLRALPQLDKLEVQGYRAKEYFIRYDQQLLKLYRLTLRDIIGAIRQNFDRSGIGKINIQGKILSVELSGSQKPDWKIPLKRHEGRIIYLTDVASVRLQEQPPVSYHRVNGKTSLILSFYPVNTANILQLQKQIDKIIRQVSAGWSAPVQIVKTYDSTAYVRAELHKIYLRTLAVLGILFLFILLITRNLRYFSVMILSLTAGMGMALLFYYFFGIRIELYSLAGITISFGLMIDNIIVVSDHLKNRDKSKVYLPVLASTFTTLAALSVIFLLDEPLRYRLRDFAWVIIINLSVSIIVALFFTPVLLRTFGVISRHPRPKKSSFLSNFYARFLGIALRFKPFFITGVVLLFGIPVFMLPAYIEKDKLWAKVYNKTLGSEWYKENIKPYADKYLGGSLRLFSYYVFEGALYRENTETKLFVTGRMPRGSNLEQFNEVFLNIDNYLSWISGIKMFKTDVYNSGYGRTEIIFDKNAEPLAFKIKGELIRKAMNWGGISWNIYGVGKGFNNQVFSSLNYNFLIEAKGYNLSGLMQWIDSLNVRLLAHPRINKIKVTGTQYPYTHPENFYRLILNREALLFYGYSPLDISRNLYSYSIQLRPAFYTFISGQYYPLRLQEKNATAFDIWHLFHMPLFKGNKMFKLNSFARIDTLDAPGVLYKKDQEYYKYIHVQYTGSSKFGKKIISRKIDSLSSMLPVGISFKLKENFYLFSRQKKDYFKLLLFIIVMIWAISMIFFENIRLSFIVVAMIPISFIGIFLIFYLFDFPFDQGGIAGFVLVSGLTVNAVYYIMYEYLFLQKHQPGKNAVQIYSEAFRRKIFPVSLTIISTILGFIPFVWSGPQEVFWFSLGVATIGGLLFSFIGLVIYLPLFLIKSHKNAYYV